MEVNKSLMQSRKVSKKRTNDDKDGDEVEFGGLSQSQVPSKKPTLKPKKKDIEFEEKNRRRSEQISKPS